MKSAKLRVYLHDGTRKLLPPDVKALVIVRPQFDAESAKHSVQPGNVVEFDLEVPPDGSGYAVIASAKGYEQASLAPLKLTKDVHSVHLMLVRKHAEYHFGPAQLELLPPNSTLRKIVLGTKKDEAEAIASYRHLLATQPDAFATLHNVAAALATVAIPNGNGAKKAIEYLQAIDWSDVRRDRFFAFASEALLLDLSAMDGKGSFKEAPSGLHPGAETSYKQVTFGEGNVQISFHRPGPRDGMADAFRRVELDMDYYSDAFSHLMLEVIPNELSFGRRKTDPRQIYVLRWMAGKLAGEEFAPRYLLI